MKEDYDTMGPEATIQTTVNNGTGKEVSTPRSCLSWVMWIQWVRSRSTDPSICMSMTSQLSQTLQGSWLFQIRILYFDILFNKYIFYS